MSKKRKRVETYTTKEALAYIEQEYSEQPSKPTLITWIHKFDLGYQTGGGQMRGFWKIYKEKFHKFLERHYGY